MFTGETDCSYFFTWETKYACVAKEDLPCMVTDKRKRYDLTRLIRHSGMAIKKYISLRYALHFKTFVHFALSQMSNNVLNLKTVNRGLF